MTADDKEMKQKIMKDWLKAFPELSMYTPNVLCKAVGPVIMGIEFITDPPGYFSGYRYRPHFFCNALWLEDFSLTKGTGLVLQEMYEENRTTQLGVPYSKHDVLFEKAIRNTREQVYVPFEGNITMDSMVKMIDHQFEVPITRVVYWMRAKVYELKFYSALYVDDKELVNSSINDLAQTKDYWNPSFLSRFYGSFEQWIQQLEDESKCRDEFLKRIHANLQKKRIKKMYHSELML